MVKRNVKDGQARRVSEADAQVGRIVERARLTAGLSRQAFSIRLGVSYEQLRKYETGINRISASQVRQIAGALRVPVTHFFPDAAGGHVTNSDDDVQAQQNLRLDRAFKSIEDSALRQRIIALVESAALVY